MLGVEIAVEWDSSSHLYRIHIALNLFKSISMSSHFTMMQFVPIGGKKVILGIMVIVAVEWDSSWFIFGVHITLNLFVAPPGVP
jgi:hypothetical protein